MQTKHEASDHHDAGPSSIADRAYTFTIITLAAVLLGLAAFRPPVSTVTHEAQLSIRGFEGKGAGEGADAPEHLVAAIKSPEAIEQALSRIRTNLHPAAPDGSHLKLIRALEDAVDVTCTSQNESDATTLQVRLTGSSEAFQYQLTRHLIDRFVEEQTRPAEASPRDAPQAGALQQRVAQAISAVDAAHERLESYVAFRVDAARREHDAAVAEHLQALESLSEDAAAPPTATTSAPLDGARLPVVQGVNPQYQALRKELDRLRQQRRVSLRSNVGTQSATALDAAIRALEEKLGDTSEYVDLFRGTQANPYASANDGPVEEDQPPANAKRPALTATDSHLQLDSIPRFDELTYRDQLTAEAEYAQLASVLHQATQSRDRALSELKEASAERRPRALASHSVEILQPPKLTARARSAVGSTQLLGILLPSAFLGAICAWFRAPGEMPGAFVDPDDVEEWLELPLVGTIATRDGPEIPELPSSEPPAIIRWCRRGSELVVCLAILVVIMSILSVSGFGRTLLADPFSAYTQAIDNVSLLLG